MAELYVDQGHPGRAVEVYRRILEGDPGNAKIIRRLAQLDAGTTSNEGEKMGFREHLQRVVESTPGASCASVMDWDGIAIDTFDAPGNPFDVTSMMAHYTGPVRQLQQTAMEVERSGEISELTITAEGLTCLLRPLNEEYFMVVLLQPGALTGKARYLTRVAAPALVREIAG